MPVATIIGAIITAGSAVTAGLLNKQSQEEANAENNAIAEKNRQDTLKQLGITNSQNRKQLEMSAASQAFAEGEANKNRVERLEQTGYNRMQNAANSITELLNQKNSTLSRLAPIINGGR